MAAKQRSSPSVERVEANTNKINISRGYHTDASIQNESIKTKSNPTYGKSITPLSKAASIDNLGSISTMDVETITAYNGEQIPAAISIAYTDGGVLHSKFFKINYLKLDVRSNKSIKMCVRNLWSQYFHFILSNPSLFKHNFVHNLGRFDGIFLYKGLLAVCPPEAISTIVDDSNSFIVIRYKLNGVTIEWKDSYYLIIK